MFRNRNKRNCRIQGTEKDNVNVMQPHKGLEIIGRMDISSTWAQRQIGDNYTYDSS
jgi:hypothetical protein